MRRALLALALLAAVALAGAQVSKNEVPDLREPAQSVNLLAGHEVTADMPDGVLVLEATVAGWTWTGPLIIRIDGRPSAKIVLPTARAAIPHRPIWPYVAAGGLGLLAGGFAGAAIAKALR